MRFASFLPGLVAAIVWSAVPASADDSSHDMAHQAMHGAVAAMPREPGQGAFAAIQEIVAILEADPSTDWSRVDIGALRQHLVDMNALVMSAEVTQREIPGGLETTVSGVGRGGEAARRMVPMHAKELAKIEGWTASGTISDGNAILTVTARDEDQIARIRGLGFFGLMATGAHHKAHHLAIARGEGMTH